MHFFHSKPRVLCNCTSIIHRMMTNKAISHARRNTLLEIESTTQTWWKEADVFNADSCQEPPQLRQKFFGNIPFPYMNGVLHLGHGFSISKLEFAAAYHRLNGMNVLLPFAFHCTGMPIKAAADKIAREIQQYGDPPLFPNLEEDNRLKYQWEIMRDLGIQDSEISKFKDPQKWLSYFPHVAMDDLKAFGLGCDWRRSFVTTEINPFFDSFVRWQMNKLKSMGKIVKEARHTIFSPLDGQPCADHDRTIGEGVQPQEYTLIKMEMVAPFNSPKMKAALEGKNVFLAALTSRPETLYGLTNAWVSPEGRYGAFEINDTDVLVLSHRAALNLAYQGLSKIPEKTSCLLKLTGSDLIGLPLKFPMSFRQILHVLPMPATTNTRIVDKGTGILTSVPSDVPLDYIWLHNLKMKPDLRNKYDLKDEWVLPLEITPIIFVDGFGDEAVAERVCKDMKIVSQNEKVKLEEATKLIDSLEGKLLVGEHAGKGINIVKPLINKSLIETHRAILYYEPASQVISRSGDECIVALTEQWFITYGEVEWKKMAEECLSSMTLYSDEARHWFEHSLSWLNKWACSRSFGLGTRIPWDEQFLVESLSDSSLYMAYYTVSHLLHGGDIYGARSNSSIRPEQMTGDVWDFIFCGGPYPTSSDIPCSILNLMKQEFEYWYPFDLRVSGKDLIQNHLMFCIYNHTAILPKHHWPRGFRCNGHLMLNAKKMAKGTGNFMTLCSSLREYGADAIRFALADAGDGLDDANFSSGVANAAVLRLTKELSWMKEVMDTTESSLRVGGKYTFADRVFNNEMNIAVKNTKFNYEHYMFREALKTGFYNLQASRDEYRLMCGPTGMNRDLLWRFVDVQIRLITPICPHFAEYVWRVLLEKEGFVVKASGWPKADEPDLNLKWANKYMQDLISRMRKLLRKKMSKKGSNEKKLGVSVVVVVKEEFDGWNAECLRILRGKYDKEECCFAPNREILDALEKSSLSQPLEPCMPFIRFKQDETSEFGVRALDLKLPFEEMKLLEENLELIKTQVGVKNVQLCSVNDLNDLIDRAGDLANINPPSPGNPTPIIMFI
ncbi:hypothetical protein DM860_007647 [Cuscuta australis]|uniref:leucine--tRNA ligase n=1 Tax=Cuscuta australis TaxID=267555 RepID=A0A328E8E9_9ASTE|nr:hypothetical protein DM860_007647 [Cuscuta australis]